MENRLILVVDDSADDVVFVRRALARADVSCQVEVCRDGAEALERLLPAGRPDGSTAPLPRLVLLDLKMPRVDGFDVMARLRADPRTAALPVVVFSSSRESCDIARAKHLGASSFVGKPVEFGDFVQAVSCLVRYWLDVDAPVPGPVVTQGPAVIEPEPEPASFF